MNLANMAGLEILEWLGAWSGLAGAALLSLRCRYSAYGWPLFLISNICWIAFAMQSGIEGLQLQHIGFMLTSLLGIYRWLIVGEDVPAPNHQSK